MNTIQPDFVSNPLPPLLGCCRLRVYFNVFSKGESMTIEELVKFIENSTQHQSLYHFTDEANLPSISQHGILSKQQLRAQGLWPPAATGGNELSWQLDQHRGIDPYVSLCMTRNHGMKFRAHQDGRLPNPRYLAIKPEIMYLARMSSVASAIPCMRPSGMKPQCASKYALSVLIAARGLSGRRSRTQVTPSQGGGICF
ncbi:hypothetical protein XH90_21690 [Bradyrhizobium sp. CCBAU 53338]|nr:hypothetical protein XH90_21690 [Bradyrhizobium sp. CCBAU 53338]